MFQRYYFPNGGLFKGKAICPTKFQFISEQVSRQNKSSARKEGARFTLAKRRISHSDLLAQQAQQKQ